MIGLLVVLFLLLAIIAVSLYFSDIIIHPKTFSFQETYDREVESGKIIPKLFESLEKEEVTITSPYGYKLFGYYLPIEGSKRTIIFCHGITWSLNGSIKYMEIFRKRGFNVLMYDHRNHGKSEGDNTTFGFYEKHDLKAWTDWVFKKTGPDTKIGTHGESLGAATVLQNTAIDDRLSFCIADCPYSDLFSLLKFRLKMEYHMPPFPFIYTSGMITRIRTGMSYNYVSPIRDVSKVNIPILFIHGQNDTYIPVSMSVDMYNVKPGAKKLYLAPNADHAQAYWNNRDDYEKQVEEFLMELGLYTVA
jgi:X-Pro dipeptidyl-peptidase (S15 family).